MKNGISQPVHTTRYQSGVVTTFTGIMILLLMALMVFFAMRVGVFEQRVSSNDMRQKQAFHSAESGLHHAKEFFRNNSALIASPTVDLLPNGADGWLADTTEKRWLKCSDASGINLASGQGSHPCFGETVVDERSETYYYSFGAATAGDPTPVPVDTDSVLPGTTEEVTVEALLCVLDVVEGEEVPVQGCITDPDSAVGIGDGTYFMITLLARGGADCDGTNPCKAEALITEQVSNFGAAAGGNSPAVPLVVRSSYEPSGTIEVVANPNAGGVGVPLSVWMNGNAACPNDGEVFTSSSGSWSTCEMHEWYALNATPEDVVCPGNTSCKCDDGEALSFTEAADPIIGMDLIVDPLFPCDLFQFYFGVPVSSYEVVKGYSKVISSCDGLGPNSFGIYWVEAAPGSECRLNQSQVGSPEAPVLLISAAERTVILGGVNIFGVLFVTGAEDHLNSSPAELAVAGGGTVYGAVLVEAAFRDAGGGAQGTFQVVWNENINEKAGATGGLGAVIGGWSDFHRDWE